VAGRLLTYLRGQNASPAAGFDVFPLHHATSATARTLTSGSLFATYFTSPSSRTVTSGVTVASGTAAGATPTLVRFGLYAVDGSGNLTSLLAATVNDTALLAGANTVYTKAWASSYTLDRATRYAVAALVVTAQTAPTLCGVAAPGQLVGVDPLRGWSWSGQSDLPADVLKSAGAVPGSLAWFRL
jgi:hypothetical protein